MGILARSRLVKHPIYDPDQGADGMEPIFLIWNDARDRIALISSSSHEGYALVPELLDTEYCHAGAFHHASLWRPLGILPAQFQLDDQPVAVSTEILDQSYVDQKNGDAWAQRMKGRWNYKTIYLNAQDDLWTLSVFDLETTAAARKVHAQLYSAQMERGYYSRANTLAKAWRWDAVYRTQIRGVPAWYLDQYSTLGTKELNFHAGPFIFALDSYVIDDDPLLMDDLKLRAQALPLLGGW